MMMIVQTLFILVSFLDKISRKSIKSVRTFLRIRLIKKSQIRILDILVMKNER